MRHTWFYIRHYALAWTAFIWFPIYLKFHPWCNFRRPGWYVEDPDGILQFLNDDIATTRKDAKWLDAKP